MITDDTSIGPFLFVITMFSSYRTVGFKWQHKKLNTIYLNFNKEFYSSLN